MDNFEMMPGDVDKPCNSDYVKIMMPAGSENVNIGKLCGYNTGQHLYIHLPQPSFNNNNQQSAFSQQMGEKSVIIKIMAKKTSQYRIKIHQVSNSISSAEPDRQI